MSIFDNPILRGFYRTIFPILGSIGLNFPVNANQIVSQSRHLKIEFLKNSKCIPNQPSATYNASHGISGVLYPECSWNNVAQDIYKYRFNDTVGKERCRGRMNLVYGGFDGIATIWYFDGAISGYKCSLVGKTISIDKMLGNISEARAEVEATAYSLYSKHIILVKRNEKICYVGLHRQDATVATLLKKNQGTNIYRIYGFDNINLIINGKKSVNFAGNKYTVNPQYDVGILSYVPETQECLNSKKPYFKLIEGRFR